MEAEKSLDMPLASWRTRKTGDEIQSETKDLRIRTKSVSPYWSQKAQEPGTSSPRAGEDGCLSSGRE